MGYGAGNRKLMAEAGVREDAATLSTISEAIALEALADKTFMKDSVRVIQAERVRLADRLREARIPPPEDRRELPARRPRPALERRLGRFLRGQGIVTREMSDFKAARKLSSDDRRPPRAQRPAGRRTEPVEGGMLALTLLDYGVGNIHSIKKCLERAGASVIGGDRAGEDPGREGRWCSRASAPSARSPSRSRRSAGS